MSRPIDDSPPLLELVEYRSPAGCVLVFHRGSGGDWFGVWRCRHRYGQTWTLPSDRDMVEVHESLQWNGWTMQPA